jgi:hypothetical protein
VPPLGTGVIAVELGFIEQSQMTTPQANTQ